MRFDFELADPSHLHSILLAIKRVGSIYEATARPARRPELTPDVSPGAIWARGAIPGPGGHSRAGPLQMRGPHADF